jgi:hypothetical protein
MLIRRTFLASLLAPLAGVTLLGDTLRAFGQAAGATPPPGQKIPPVAYTCPMHAEVVDDEGGKCPICAMTLVPIRLALVYSCPEHREITKFEAGECPIDGRVLLRVTKAVTFTCKVHPKVDELNPGNCPICKRVLVMKYAIRPHGDHNPKHGGFFLMASNNWHVEVTHPVADVFRLYVYDAYSKPFTPPGLTARIIEAVDQSEKKRAVDVPFKHVPRGGYLEARLPGASTPISIAAKVRFEAHDAEYRCDFQFFEYSVEPVAGRRK